MEVLRLTRPGRRAAATLAALVCALFAFGAGPSSAAAAVFEVNSPNDGPKTVGGPICEATFPGECTLRAAIEAANEDPGPDEIKFSTAIFNGVAGADEIEPATALPTIAAPVSVVGRTIAVGSELKPSVGVKAPVGVAALKVGADEVTISHLAVGGGSTGIEVLGGSTRFTALGDWFGLRLDATAEAITGAALSLGTAADEATIGSGEFGLATGNVFAHAEVGVEIKGASKATVQGNYIGVQPDGTGAAGLETGVRIEDFAAPAEDDEIGGVLGPSEIAAMECVGPCNAIATETGGQGIDLAGSASDPQQAAHGPTAIRGNFIGLEPDGTGTVGDSAYGVRAGPSEGGCAAGPRDVTVGGVQAGARNYIAGGTFGIEAESAENFSVLGNAIGVQPNGSATTSPGASAISLCAESVTEPALVSGNEMVLEPGTIGIESFFGQAVILGNSIQGGLIGIETREASVGGGSVISANTITEPDTRGIQIEDDLNVVTGNTITKAGRAGIEIETDADHNRIGGDAPGEANTIIETMGPEPEDAAITLFGRETGRNEIAANTGFANPGAFIKLLGHGGSEKPNGGIQPPVLAAVRQSSASGTADADATVRIFSKASSEPGELGVLLAVAKADAGGAWAATYPTQPVGTLVTATQTSEAGTAEAGTSALAAASPATADPMKPEEPKGGGGDPTQHPPTTSPPPPSMPVAPKVKITSGPKKSGTATAARFKFRAEPSAGAKFECKLDGAKWARCGSPKTYKKLKPARHTFRVRATASGLTGAVAKYQFTVKS
jgi:hypothetical protein